MLTGLVPRAAWTTEQARRARQRMLRPWQACLAQCHGVRALRLDNTATPETDAALPMQALRMASVWHFGRSFLAGNGQWPIQPGCLDLLIWRVCLADSAAMPALISQMSQALGPSARVLICVEAPMLNAWCRIGMPLCRGHDWTLRQADWGDARLLTWLPPRWSSKWSADLQVWLPHGAQWTVQLWQRDTVCPTSSSARRRSGKRLVTDLRWQPQSTVDPSL